MFIFDGMGAISSNNIDHIAAMQTDVYFANVLGQSPAVTGDQL